MPTEAVFKWYYLFSYSILALFGGKLSIEMKSHEVYNHVILSVEQSQYLIFRSIFNISFRQIMQIYHRD
jgi:hypothetical protein